MTKVKVGKVTNLSEARYCAGMGVDFLSFPISSIDSKTYQEITAWVAGPKFGIEVDTENISALNEYKSDFIEINAAQLERFKENENLIVSLEAGDWLTNKSNLLLSKSNILYLELKVKSLDENTLGIINDITEDFKLLLKPESPSSILQPATNNQQLTTANWLPSTPVDGLSFDGNPETKPGLKEYPLSEILEKLELAD
jgi:phosphoribosylanthranilate isomerase